MSPTANLIRNIWGIGRNYADHARELGNQVPESSGDPLIFLKAGSSIVENGASFRLPAHSSDVHHECELALRFGPGGHFSEMTLALDLTARDVQSKLKAQAHPWTLAKSFTASCPLGPLVPIPKSLNLGELKFEFRVNGELRQRGDTRDLIHSIEKMRLFVLQHFPVVEGDLLLTGTPAGVGPLMPGDTLMAEIPGLVKAKWTVLPN